MSARTMVLGNRPLIVRNGLTAGGTTRATALQLTGNWNRITSVPTDSASVRLPPALVGASVTIIRADYSNTNRLAVHAMGTDQIGPGFDVILLNAPAGAAGMLVVQSFICALDGIWDTDISVASAQSVASAALAGSGAVACASIHTPVGAAALAGHGALTAGAVWVSRAGNSAALAGAGALACLAH